MSDYKSKYLKCAVLLKSFSKRLKEEKQKSEIRKSINKFRNVSCIPHLMEDDSMDVLIESLDLVDYLNRN